MHAPDSFKLNPSIRFVVVGLFTLKRVDFILSRIANIRSNNFLFVADLIREFHRAKN